MKVNEERSNRCLVVKFGGSSLADGLNVLRAAKSVADEKRSGTKIAVVVSAMGKTTDHLISTAKEACNTTLTPKESDDIIAMGEKTSARIFAAALRAQGERCVYLDPSEPSWPIVTDSSFSNAKPILPRCEEMIKKTVEPLLNEGTIVVIPGFIGKTEKGEITTMGRGGSDLTAMVLARGISADKVILVTDVDGIMTADPKIIEKPLILREVTVNVLVGLADSGSKFIHKKALRYKSDTIDVKVINNSSGNLRSEGTIIRGGLPENISVELCKEASMSVTIVGSAISESPKTLQSVFQEISRFNVSIQGMSINHDSLILYLPMSESSQLLEALHSIVTADERAIAMAVRQHLFLINIKDIGLEETPGIVSAISGALASSNVNIYGVFTIASSVLLFVDVKDKERAVQLIKDSVRKYTSQEDEDK